jgi:NADPH-dependent stearoyl-CoA 9-desaturase
MTSKQLTAAEADAFGRELDALRLETLADLGQRDVDHIRRVIRLVRYAEVAGRVLLHVGVGPLTFALGVSALGASKILENMEVGHNVMHGQYDWTGDPALDSRAYEWDIVCTGDDWRHSHNFEHHTFTNVLGRDRDVGYGFLRVSNAQRWQPQHVIQPIAVAILALLFEWGVGLHDMRINETLAGRQSLAELGRRARPVLRKAAWQLSKDYVAFPALALWNAPRVLAGNLLANVMRNVWTFGVIFCGHFSDGVRFYTVAETENEGRGEWYLRQLNGSANIEGGRAFHVMTGHLSHQIEHHLFPDLPASRYPELAPKVRAICERYDQQYITGNFVRQLTSVARQLVTNALPNRTGARGVDNVRSSAA